MAKFSHFIFVIYILIKRLFYSPPQKKRTPPKRAGGRGSAGSSRTGSRPGTPSIDSASTSNTLRAAASKLEQGVCFWNEQKCRFKIWLKTPRLFECVLVELSNSRAMCVVVPSLLNLPFSLGKRQIQGLNTDSPAAKRLKMEPSTQSPVPSGKSTPQPASGKSTPSSRYSVIYLYMIICTW